MARRNNMPSEHEIDEFFRQLEEECPFPAQDLANLLGADRVAEWEQISTTQSLSWIWVFLAEMSLVSFPTPNVRFLPLASMKVFNLVWCFGFAPRKLSHKQSLASVPKCPAWHRD